MVPLPLEAKLSWPGFDLASSISSFMSLTGSMGLTTRTLGTSATWMIGAKSLIGSYGSFESDGPIECVLLVAISRV